MIVADLRMPMIEVKDERNFVGELPVLPDSFMVAVRRIEGLHAARSDILEMSLKEAIFFEGLPRPIVWDLVKAVLVGEIGSDDTRNKLMGCLGCEIAGRDGRVVD